MQVIGVVDLAAGMAVHARGGRRADYQPVRVPGRRLGDAEGLARFYRELGVGALYVADLDAIAGSRLQHSEIRGLTACGLPLWVDAGIDSPERADAVLRSGAAKVVVGLETLPSLEVLTQIGRTHDSEMLVFSLDLRDGAPLLRSAELRGLPAETIAAYAAGAGFGHVIVLDLARVGMGLGLDVSLPRRVRDAVPGVTLVAGGGVRDNADLHAAADAGCDAVLVASALLDGRMTAADVHASSRR